MIQFLGDGTFGRVLECENIFNKSTYAMKIIKPVSRYIESAKIETDIIKDINKKDKDNKSHCIKVADSFSFHLKGEHFYAILFERLGKSLYEFLKENNYLGFSMNQIQIFARQIFEGIGTLHKMGIIHSDLKPENILFTSTKYHKIIDKSRWPMNAFLKDKKTAFRNMFYHIEENNSTSYMQMDNPEVKIIDFGGAVYTTESCTGLINTRQYRSPEVIMRCCKWNTKSDVWSIACILAELYTGELLFNTHEDTEHLCLIEKVCGNFPNWMVLDSDNSIYKIFKKDYRESIYCIDINQTAYPDKAYKAKLEQNLLDDLIQTEHKEFAKFLHYLLQIDPNKRPSCDDALAHEFFKERFID